MSVFHTAAFQATQSARPYRFELLPEGAMASALELLNEPSGDVSGELDGAVTRGLQGALAFADAQAAEQRRALILLSELSMLDFPAMSERIERYRPPFRSAELCRLLFDKCFEEAHRNRRQAVEFSRLALLAAELIDTSDLPPAIWRDIQAEAWAVVADTHRMAADLQEAKRAFKEAEKHLRAGSGTLMVRAELLIRKASLRCDLEHHEQGLRSIDQALCILRAGALPGEVSRALIVKGRLHLESNHPEVALSLFKEAWDLARDLTDRAQVLAIHHNMAACLCELEQFDEAAQPLAIAKSTTKLLARPLGMLHVRWLEGRQAAGMGDVKLAEEAYGEAIDGFNSSGLEAESTRVGFDLARLYLRHRRVDRIHRLARPLLPALRGHRQAWRLKPVADRSW